MTTPFYKGQVIKARRSEVDKYQRGWYISESTGHDLHLVHIEGHGPMEVKGDNLQVHDDNIQLAVSLLVFINDKGEFFFSVDTGNGFLEENFKTFMGKRLVGKIDLTPFNITFPEGEGLLPKRYKTDTAKADR